MARLVSYETIERKARLSPGELIQVTTPSHETVLIMREEELEERKAARVQKRKTKKRLERASIVMSPRQRSVFLLDIAGLNDETIAHRLGITSGAAQTYRCEYRQALKNDPLSS